MFGCVPCKVFLVLLNNAGYHARAATDGKSGMD